MSSNRRGEFAFERNAVIENRHEAQKSKMKLKCAFRIRIVFTRYEFCHLVIHSGTDTAKIRVFFRWKVMQSSS